MRLFSQVLSLRYDLVLDEQMFFLTLATSLEQLSKSSKTLLCLKMLQIKFFHIGSLIDMYYCKTSILQLTLTSTIKITLDLNFGLITLNISRQLRFQEPDVNC